MNRREVIAGLALPLMARGAWAQSEPPRRIGALVSLPESDPEGGARLHALRAGLAAMGWTDGGNTTISHRFVVGDDTAATRAAALEVLGEKPDVVLVHGTPLLAGLKREARTMPIVFVSVADPVGQGFVPNLARPGGTVTGFTAFEFTIGAKWVEILKEVDPAIVRIGACFNPKSAPYYRRFLSPIADACAGRGVSVTRLEVGDTSGLDDTIGGFASGPKGAIIFLPDNFVSASRQRIVDGAARHRIAAIYAWPHFVTAGGLMSYGTDQVDIYRAAAAYIDRILRGATAGDLPVQQPVKHAFFVNLKTAAALGLSIPATLLARADEVIE